MTRPIYSAAESRAIDATAIAAGTPGVTLMERAGRAVADAAVAAASGGRVVVVAGIGQNGGDGFVVGWVLHGQGVPVSVVLVGDRGQVAGDARIHLERLEATGAPTFDVTGADGLAALEATLDGAEVVVDALFGTGLSRPLEGLHADVVARVNEAVAVRIAVDVPSGVHADDGRVLGVAVRADRTICMAGFKRGLVMGEGVEVAGALEACDLGLELGPHGLEAFVAADAAALVPRARAGEHKGARGHVVIVGGAAGTRGAGQLAALGALRAGAGLCTLAAPPDGTGEVPAPMAVMTQALVVGAQLALPAAAAVVVGPGAGRDAQARAVLERALAGAQALVLDADALALLGTELERARRAAPTILTPHPKEAARLLGRTTEEVEADRPAAARALATGTGAVIVLKGARTIVDDGARATVNLGGHPALATGGTGDVLAGVIGALLAQGLVAPVAARVGVHVHARAGELLGARFGGRGAIASDLPEAVALALGELTSPSTERR
ncbi:MAG: NAD(P)H-hydrate dehydratase [Kofleriaceae bacterium]